MMDFDQFKQQRARDLAANSGLMTQADINAFNNNIKNEYIRKLQDDSRGVLTSDELARINKQMEYEQNPTQRLYDAVLNIIGR